MTKQRTPAQPSVYRIYDETGRLIYVGASSHVDERIGCHRSQSWWFALTARIDVEVHLTTRDAFQAEKRAIRSERPAFNATHKGGLQRDLTDDDVRVCREWLAAAEANGWPGGRAGGLPLSLRWIADLPSAA